MTLIMIVGAWIMDGNNSGKLIQVTTYSSQRKTYSVPLMFQNQWCKTRNQNLKKQKQQHKNNFFDQNDAKCDFNTNILFQFKKNV